MTRATSVVGWTRSAVSVTVSVLPGDNVVVVSAAARVVGADPADLVRIHPGQQGGQAGQAGQFVPAVPAGHQVRVDQSALGGIDSAEHVHAKRWPGVGAVPYLGHGASPRSCNASLSAFNA